MKHPPIKIPNLLTPFLHAARALPWHLVTTVALYAAATCTLTLVIIATIAISRLRKQHRTHS